MNENPYASPTAAASADASDLSDAESIRKQYLAHEASVKSIGTLYMLGAILLILMGVSTILVSLFTQSEYLSSIIIMAISGLFYGGFGALQGATAFGIRRLQPWARWVAVVFSCIGLIAIPIGTLISGYILYLLLSAKGKMVFSEEYKQVIAATPHIKYKTSIVIVILLVFLAVLIIGGVLAALFVG